MSAITKIRSDLLRQEYINSLPQPFLVRLYGRKDIWWPMPMVCVETGAAYIDVVGLPQPIHFSEVAEIKDDSGKIHDPDDWYNEEDEK